MTAPHGITSSGSLPPPPAPEHTAPAPKPKKTPAGRGPEGSLEALRWLCEAAGAVTLELNVGSCSIRVQAESLEQLGAVAGFLGAITCVSDSDTGGGGR